MLTENQTRWLAALRSGDFKQGHSYLRTCKDEFCCLGVAAEMFKPDDLEPEPRGALLAYDGEACLAPQYVVNTLNLRDFLGSARDPSEYALSSMNDAGKTFAEIADIIEANPEEYFRG